MSNLYENLKNLERAKESERQIAQQLDLIGGKSLLETKMKRVIEGIRKIGEDKKSKEIFYYHKITDYWEEDQIKEFKIIEETIGLDVPKTLEGNDKSRDYVNSIIESFIISGKNNCYAFHNMKNGLKLAPMLIPSLTLGGGCLGAGFDYFGNHLTSQNSISFLIGGVCGVCATIMTGIYTLNFIKNPFERVASSLEERTKYILERI